LAIKDLIDISLIVVIAIVETVDNSNNTLFARIISKTILWIKNELVSKVLIVKRLFTLIHRFVWIRKCLSIGYWQAATNNSY